MTGIEFLGRIRDKSARENILQTANGFVTAVHPLQVILFGSFADGTYTDESDYAFYLQHRLALLLAVGIDDPVIPFAVRVPG